MSRGRRVAVFYLACRWVLAILALLALVRLALAPGIHGLGVGGVLAVAASVCASLVALELAAAQEFGNRSVRLDPSERRAYQLRLGGRMMRRNGPNAAPVLLQVARCDIQLGDISLAREDLSRLDAAGLRHGDQLKLYYLLWIAVEALEASEADPAAAPVSEADWVARYTGIPAIGERRFPSDGEVRGWARQQADADTIRSAVAATERIRKQRPVVTAACGLMFAHCLFYLGLLCGMNQQLAWNLRVGYATVGGLLAGVFMVALAVIALMRLARAPQRNNKMSRARRIGLGVCRTIALLIVIASAAYLMFCSIIIGDGDERVLGHVGPYDYLAVNWRGYEPDESSTRYYRASDPFLMESWPAAAKYDKNAAGAPSNTVGFTTGQDSDSSSSDGSESDVSQEDAVRPSDGSSDSSDTLATQNQMSAAYEYLRSQGNIPNMTLSFSTSAKGDLYAVIGSDAEDVDGTRAPIEWRLYDNGQTTDQSGSPSEELVLEKCYPNGGRDDELLGFYLVNTKTLDVTDEHRTSW